MENIRTTLSKNFTRLIESSGMKQVDILKELKIDKSTLSRWKKGTNPPDLANLERIAELLGVDPWDFYKKEDEHQEKPVSIRGALAALGEIPEEVLALLLKVKKGDKDTWTNVKTALKHKTEKREEKNA